MIMINPKICIYEHRYKNGKNSLYKRQCIINHPILHLYKNHYNNMIESLKLPLPIINIQIAQLNNVHYYPVNPIVLLL